MKFFKQNIIIVIIGILLFCITIYFISQKNFYQPLKIIVEAKIETPDVYQLFYSTGKDFNQEESIGITVYPSKSFQKIIFKLPHFSTIIKSFRIDTGSQTKNIEIRQILLKTKKQSLSWKPQEILNEFSGYFDFSLKEVKGDALHFETSGNDPQFIYSGEKLNKIDLKDGTKKTLLYILIFIFFVITFIIIFLLKANISKFIKNSNFRFIIIFIILLFIPLSQMIFKYFPEKELKENRNLAEFPNVNLLTKITSYSNFIKSFESFFNDHYGLRTILIKIDSVFNIRYFHQSPLHEVVIGKDGWFFWDSKDEKDATNTITGINLIDFYGKALFSENETKIIKSNLIYIKNKLKKQNIDLIVILAANKQSVYPEYLPKYIQQKGGIASRADQINEIANEINLNYIDTRPILLEAKNKYPYPLYYKTDTHWNNLAAFITSQAVIEKISSLGYKPNNFYKKNNIIIRQEKNISSNDLLKFINFTQNADSSGVTINLQNNFSYIFTKNEIYNNLTYGYSISELKNNSFPRITIFRDSFSGAMQPFLSESFSQIAYIRSTNINFDIIEKEKPNIVIFEFAERFSSALLQLGI